MTRIPICLHDERGYFVGCLILGIIERLSVEYYASQDICLKAIHQRSWTRRRALIH